MVESFEGFDFVDEGLGVFDFSLLDLFDGPDLAGVLQLGPVDDAEGALADLLHPSNRTCSSN